MTKAEIQTRLEPFNNAENISVELYIQFLDENGDISTSIPAVEESELAPALRRIVGYQIRNKFFNSAKEANYKVVSINTAEADHVKQIFHVKKDKIPKTEAIFGEVINDTATTLSSNMELEKIWGYIYKVSSGDATIYLFKRNYAVSVLKKDRSYSVFFSNTRLSLLKEDLLRLSNHFDVMLSEDDLIINNKNEFEKAFDYVGAMQASAKTNLAVIKKAQIIEDMNKIALLAKEPKTLRKLLNINSKSVILSKTPPQIVKLAKKYKIEFEMTEDNSKLTVTTKKAAIAFVELLNDNYLKSEFSKSIYKIRGKSEIKDKQKKEAKSTE